MNELFTDVEVGERVMGDFYGPGTIETPIWTAEDGRKKFTVKFDDGFVRDFHLDGREELDDPKPSLRRA